MTQEEGAKVKDNQLLGSISGTLILASQSMGSGEKKAEGKCLCLKRRVTAADYNFNV